MAIRINGKILYLVTEDWSFLSHRLPVARAARDAGFEVVIASRISNHRAEIEAEGFRAIPLIMDRKSRNPIRELITILEIIQIYRRERPDITHHVAIKPILYGSIAALVTGVPKVINAFIGLGYVFMGNGMAQKFLRLLIIPCLRFLLSRPNMNMIVQNKDDQDLLLSLGIGQVDSTTLIPGSGVDVHHYPFTPEFNGPITVALVGRMLWDKGVGEYVEALRILRDQKIELKSLLVGSPDPANPKSIDEEMIGKWETEGLLEWNRHEPDIRNVWKKAQIAVLPSYREGMPKSLLEAAAMGRPLIACDVPGCRDLIKHGENGLLVPVQNAQSLAESMKELALDAARRQRLGQAAHQIIQQTFSDKAVAKETLRLYQKLLKKKEA